MSKPLAIIAELQRRYAADWDGQAPTREDIAEWAAKMGSELRLYEGVGAELARGYFARRYSFEFCDAAVNQFWALMIDRCFDEAPPPWPSLFVRVYDAFDAGEWHRREDRSDDPIAQFTNPLIADIVSGL